MTAAVDSNVPFSGVLTTDAHIRELYRAPGPVVTAKVKVGLDAGSRQFIALAPFLMLATRGADGRVDVSPRGGDAGFVSVIDDNAASYLAIPDLNGNNLLDSISNIVATGSAGTLFLLPGSDETVRVNGAAWVITDDAVLDRFTEYRRPKAAIVIRTDEVFVHCAKAFRRSQMWHPETWSTFDNAPDLVDIVCAQGLVGEEHVSAFRSSLASTYVEELALDRE